MNRSNNFNYIEEKLVSLSQRMKARSKLNILDYNIHSEDFFAFLLNLVFDFNLKNMNEIKQNQEGIDLIDTERKILVQVSQTCSKQKIENSLNKKVYEEYEDYNFKFLSIGNLASSNFKNSSFSNPYHVHFNPKEDIWDISTILEKIQHFSIDKQNDIYDFIKKELGEEILPIKIDSNLAQLINILAQENLNEADSNLDVVPFEIKDKIEYNQLDTIKDLIKEYYTFGHKLEQIYTEYDREGNNKSFSVLQEIRRQYFLLKNSSSSAVEIFFKIQDNITNIILNSKNYLPIAYEELKICVDIIVVDAFIRCKIFEKPEGHQNVTT